MTQATPGSDPRAEPLDRTRTPEPGALRPFRFPTVVRRAASNGIPVLVAPSHRLPVVTLRLLLEAGGTHEPPDEAGLALLTGSLLESGTGERSAAEIAERLEGLGVQVEVGTSWDFTHVELTALADRFRPAVGIVADLVRRPAFPATEVSRLRAEQHAGIVQRRADPRTLANEMASHFIFAASSPYARALAGTPATVERLDGTRVKAFHAERYSPQVAALVVTGDVAPETAFDLAEEAFGGWAGGLPGAIRVSTEARSPARRVVIVDRPGSVQSEIRAGHVGVARDTPDYFPLVVMNTILGGAFSSRLNLNLRERHGFTYGASSALVMRRHPGPFLVSTAVQTEVTAPALREILSELEHLREAPPSTAELQDARSYVAGTFPLRLQTTEGVASRLAELVVYGLADDYYEQYRDRVLSVTADDTLRVAREHLRPDELAVVIVGDAAAIRTPLEELGIGPVEVIAAPGGIE